MLHGERVALRGVRRDEWPLIYKWEADDPATAALLDSEPWAPKTLEAFLRSFEEREPKRPEAPHFGIDVDGELVGTVLLWGLDRYHRTAHIGIALWPEHRG